MKSLLLKSLMSASMVGAVLLGGAHGSLVGAAPAPTEVRTEIRPMVASGQHTSLYDLSASLGGSAANRIAAGATTPFVATHDSNQPVNAVGSPAREAAKGMKFP